MSDPLDRMAENARELGLDYEPARQEPVAWISKHGVVYPLDAKDEVHPINELQPLYTSPPAQRTWVGLSEEETGHWAADFLAGAKWAEAKLKQKNT